MAASAFGTMPGSMLGAFGGATPGAFDATPGGQAPSQGPSGVFGWPQLALAICQALELLAMLAVALLLMHCRDITELPGGSGAGQKCGLGFGVLSPKSGTNGLRSRLGCSPLGYQSFVGIIVGRGGYYHPYEGLIG